MLYTIAACLPNTATYHAVLWQTPSKPHLASNKPKPTSALPMLGSRLPFASCQGPRGASCNGAHNGIKPAVICDINPSRRAMLRMMSMTRMMAMTMSTIMMIVMLRLMMIMTTMMMPMMS